MFKIEIPLKTKSLCHILTGLTLFTLNTATPVLANTQIIENDCSPVDVREAMPPTLREHFLTSTDQGNTGFCTSYAAADMLAQLVGKPVSPLSIATGYSNNKGPLEYVLNKFANIPEEDRNSPETYWPGYIPNAISSAIDQKAVCTTTGVPHNANFFYSPTGNTKGFGVWYEFADFVKVAKEIQDDLCEEDCQKGFAILSKNYLPHLNPTQVRQYFIRTKGSQKNLMATMQTLMQSNCQKGNDVSVPSNIQIQMSWANQPRLTPKQKENAIGTIPETFFEALNGSLNRGKVVGLHYNVAPLFKKENNSIFLHASPIIARKLINNKCHYLIRNSWGPVEEKVTESGILTSSIYRDDLPYEQRSGSIWIPKDLLKEVSINLVYIK